MIQHRFIALGVAAVAGAAVAQPNLVGNAGFEDPIAFNFPAPDDNWVAFFGSGTVRQDDDLDRNTPLTGESNLLIGGSSDFNGVLQTIQEVSGGQAYEWGLNASIAGGLGDDMLEFRIEWTDADGNVVDVDGDGVIEDGFGPDDSDDRFFNNLQIQDLVSTEYSLFTVTGVAPTDATQAVFVIGSSAGGPETLPLLFNVDDVFFRVPTPGGVAMMGLAGLAVARRRR